MVFSNNSCVDCSPSVDMEDNNNKVTVVTTTTSSSSGESFSSPPVIKPLTDSDRVTSNNSTSVDDNDSSSPAPKSPTTCTATATVNANSTSFTLPDPPGTQSSSFTPLTPQQTDVVIMPDDFSRKLVAQVNRRLDGFLAKSPYIRANTKLNELPRFTPSHLNLGKTLAKGGFSNIIEVNSFNNEECVLRPASSVDDDEQQHYNGTNKEYVVKCLSTRLGLKKLPGATKDIVFEAHTLACLQHDNIVQIRGWSHDGINGFQTTKRADGFFMILDRLGDTLFQRVFQWQAELRGRGKYSSLCAGSKKKISHQKIAKQQFQEKIQICLDVAAALAYCHSKRICHRDIKSANVAFDPARPHRAKLIDFGLATELPTLTSTDSRHKTFDLTGNIGTARYMAPELILEKPYNEKADVHSFAVLCWEACAAKKPYSSLDAKAVKEHVSRWNERPKTYWSWPRKLRKILKQGWARDPKDRPSMQEFHTALRKVQAGLPKSSLNEYLVEQQQQQRQL
ncbi:Probable LIM domain-containing serine/threonine-protein kinase DDB_G0287001 [Seminavis robusta]|uniref:Probable LIM domain-containing serine/threonine-protein kinase DDB_G0287001 n=1 Tax=Seminavis robusta TaxID=568900 RepID=A0A9N8H4N2_9STRA|nr:Probable LIM domain-containing serine/threonine-protein kinase DDB_G0287001 [Seminavis robusta]|eukprot:Sro119_g058100.1 Probable LIM domain-containing serine/threonine-protein kinase DDB_G0287001 (508) ;mRNA; f:64563-66086